LFQKGLNGVGKEKKFHAKKSGTKRSLFRQRRRLLHANGAVMNSAKELVGM
jgi:hypothetical protein